MKLTFGELSVITDTLQRSINIQNWGGFTEETRQMILDKIRNAQDLAFEVKVVEDEN